MSRADVKVENVVERGLTRVRRLEAVAAVRREASVAVTACMHVQQGRGRNALAKAFLGEVVTHLVALNGELSTASLLSAISKRLVPDQPVKLIVRRQAEALFKEEAP